MQKPYRGAFTLIELLVVLAIIVALLAILMPSMGRAKALMEVTTCQSNLRQVGVGTIAYTQAYNGRLTDCWKWETDSNVWGAWSRPIGAPSRISPSVEGPGGLLWPFVLTEDIFVCPTFVTQAQRFIPAGNRVVWSYAQLESIKWSGDWWGIAIRRITDPYIQPAAQLIISEEAPYVPTPVASYQLNNSCLGVSRDPNPSSRIDSVAPYHLSNDPTLMTGNGNALFVDGHAELRRVKEPIDSKVLAFPVDMPAYLWLNN